MRYETGDLFDPKYLAGAICVPTNLGWGRGTTGPRAIMGAGVARQAAALWPSLIGQLGSYYHDERERAQVVGFSVFNPSAIVFCFPTKPLASRANQSWRYPAHLPLIAKSCDELVRLVDQYDAMGAPRYTVALPRVGCGENTGQLAWDDVLPVLEKRLDERFVLVSTPRDVARDRHRSSSYEDVVIEELFV